LNHSRTSHIFLHRLSPEKSLRFSTKSRSRRLLSIPRVGSRPIFVEELLDARQTCRSIGAMDHHHALSVPRTSEPCCSRLHSVGRALARIVDWLVESAINGAFGCCKNLVIRMGTLEALAPLPVGGASHAAPAVAPDADFDARWAAWVKRGRAHEQCVRRRFVIWAGVLTMGATIVYAFLRS
jgi:hypothetical protein